MAQLRNRMGLARRLGLSGRSAALGALVAVSLVLGGLGVARAMTRRTGFSIVTDSAEAGETEGGPGATRSAETEAADASGDVSAEEVVTVYVHVDGAVGCPGVYAVTGTMPRVNDAVECAGGLADDADTSSVNLAAPLIDGQKVYVPCEGEAVAEHAAPAGTSDTGAVLININLATADELMTLPGVGEATAAAIIEERERGGPYLAPEDIMRVSGIGEKKYQKLADLIAV